MPSSGGRSRAPRYYGAWVQGVYYNPGEYLPAGTDSYKVIDIENLTGTRYGWRAVQKIISVGTRLSEIDDLIAEEFQDLRDKYLIKED